MEQHPDKVERLYDTVAKEYAEQFRGEHQKKPKDREILQRFSRAIGDGKPVWDLGCGPGQTAAYLRNLGVEISGLDISGGILKQAKVLWPDIHFEKGSLLDLAFNNDSVAGAVAFYAMVHFTEEQVRLALREIFRVLRPGGQFLFTFHIGEETIHLDQFLGKEVDIDVMFFRTDFIFECFLDCGFEKIEMIEREPYPEVEYQSRRAYVFARKPTA